MNRFGNDLMRTNDASRTIELVRGQLWRTHAGTGTIAITVIEGRIWLTDQRHGSDCILAPGERYAGTNQGLMLLESLTPHAWANVTCGHHTAGNDTTHDAARHGNASCAAKAKETE